jgi:hypothetical protein
MSKQQNQQPREAWLNNRREAQRRLRIDLLCDVVELQNQTEHGPYDLADWEHPVFDGPQPTKK